MKLRIQHKAVQSTDSLDSYIENEILSLHEVFNFQEVDVVVAKRWETHPPAQVQIRASTGNQLVAAEAEHVSLTSAFDQAIQGLAIAIQERSSTHPGRRSHQ